MLAVTSVVVTVTVLAEVRLYVKPDVPYQPVANRWYGSENSSS